MKVSTHGVRKPILATSKINGRMWIIEFKTSGYIIYPALKPEEKVGCDEIPSWLEIH